MLNYFLTLQAGDEFASNFIVLSPEIKLTDDGKTVTVMIKVEDKSSVEIYRSDTETFGSWSRVDASINNGVAEFQTDQGGVFVARAHRNVGPIIGIVIGLVAVGLIVIAAVVYFKKNPEKWTSLKGSAKYAEKSLSDKV